MKTLKIDPEFKSLIPPLTDDERCQLEENILSSGYVEPIATWNNVIIDGHHRYDICQHHEIDFETRPMQFASRQGAVEWVIRNQFGRRNISNYDRAKLALKLKPIIQEQARERLATSTGGVAPRPKATQPPPKSAEADNQPVPKSAQAGEKGETVEKLAEIAGVGKEIIRKVAVIEEKATPEEKKALSSGDVSVNAVHKAIERRAPRPPKDRKLPTDDYGRELPNKLIPLWNRRDEVKDYINYLHALLRHVKKACETHDPLYDGNKQGRRPLHWQTFEASVKTLINEFKPVYVTAVCPMCQGEGCRACCGNGLISDWHLNTVPEAFKRGMKKQAQ